MIVINKLTQLRFCPLQNALELLETALDLLFTDARPDSGKITLRSRPIWPGRGNDVYVVSLVFTPDEGDPLAIGLPSATYFSGTNRNTKEVARRSASDLDGASVEISGDILLKCGDWLHAIDIRRPPDFANLSELDEKIAHFFISSLPNNRMFYGSPYARLPSDVLCTIPNQPRLDWSKIYGAGLRGELTAPDLKVLCYDFCKETNLKVTKEKVRTALLSCGLPYAKRPATARTH